MEGSLSLRASDQQDFSLLVGSPLALRSPKHLILCGNRAVHDSRGPSVGVSGTYEADLSDARGPGVRWVGHGIQKVPTGTTNHGRLVPL